jgi:alpha-galactosidase/6-phospho-beta-glucosidase family protein
MQRLKIVVIGAGSASFGLETMGMLLQDQDLKGSTLALVDLNEEGLAQIHRLAERMTTEWGTDFQIVSTTDRRRVLAQADFVIISIETGPREELWQLDYQIGLRNGLTAHYAENGGPGGFFHTARNIPPLLAIARDIAELCPNAWLINLTNPLPRLTRAITKYTGVKAVGLCHQVMHGYRMAGVVLSDALGLDAPDVIELENQQALRHDFERRILERISIRSAGLNHFIWAMGMHDRLTGEDLLPVFKQEVKKFPVNMMPLTRKTYDVLGVLPLGGDTHLSEYLHWLHNPQNSGWDRYGLHHYDWIKNKARRDHTWERIDAMIKGDEPLVAADDYASQGAHAIITGIAYDKRTYWQAVNLPNKGYITNLPDGVIVEVPGIIDSMGVTGVTIGDLPDPVAELCRREVILVDMVVDASVKGDRDLALQALLFDPMIDDIEMAEHLLDDYLTAHTPYLPQFFTHAQPLVAN